MGKRGYFGIGLYRPLRDENVGGVLRSATCFDASFVAIQGKYKRESSDTPNTPLHKPVFLVEDLFSVIPQGCVPIAVELVEGARNLINFTHPERAFYIFNSERGSLPQEIIDRCSCVVQIPTVQCLNLSHCVAVVSYDRMAKQAK